MVSLLELLLLLLDVDQFSASELEEEVELDKLIHSEVELLDSTSF